jgi:hypothetical protein
MTENAKCYSFNELLGAYPKIKKLQTDKYQIIFECEDGYKPMMPLQNSYPQNLFWQSVMSMLRRRIVVKNYKDGHEMEAAPFYLIYQGLSPKTPISNGLIT